MYITRVTQNLHLADLFNDFDKEYGENWFVFNINHRLDFDLVYVTIKIEEDEQDD